MHHRRLLLGLLLLSIGCGKKESPAPSAHPDAVARAAQELEEAGEPRELRALRARQAVRGHVNYKQFAPFFPDQLGPYKAANALEGVNDNVARGVVLATALRHYRQGERLLIITVSDAMATPVSKLLKGAERSDDVPDLGTITRGEVGKYPALFSWFGDGGESRAYVLVDERVVELRMPGAAAADDAREAARHLRFELLEDLRGEPAKK